MFGNEISYFFPCLPTFIKVKYNLKAKLNTTYNVVSDGQTLKIWFCS